MTGPGEFLARAQEAGFYKLLTPRRYGLDFLSDHFFAASFGAPYVLHGNPMYAGRSLGLFMCELTAIVVGAGKAALDEYERIITSRYTTWGPKQLRYQHADYQRHRLAVVATQAARQVYAAVQDLFQFAGSTASRNDHRMQRYVRDLGTYWSHNTPSQFELLSQTLAMLHLGFPKDQLPAPGA